MSPAAACGTNQGYKDRAPTYLSHIATRLNKALSPLPDRWLIEKARKPSGLSKTDILRYNASRIPLRLKQAGKGLFNTLTLGLFLNLSHGR